MRTVSLRTQLMLMTILPALLAALVIGGFAMSMRIADVRDTTAHRQLLIIDSYAARITAQQAPSRERLEDLLQQLLEEPEVRAATLQQPGRLEALHAGPRLRPVKRSENLGYGQRWISDQSWQLVRDLSAENGARLTVEFSRQGQYATTLETLLILILVTLVLILLAAIPALRFSRQLTNPVNDMVAMVKKVRDGNLEVGTLTPGKGELGELSQALQQMVEALNNAQAELQQNVDQATQDLRETLETIEIQNIELDMARKEALKASQIKSEFLANMSHEIRTPLNAIIGFTRLLQKSELSARQIDYLLTIHKSADSLLSIINDILDFSKIEAGKLSLEQLPLNLHDLVEDVQNLLAPLAQERGLEQAAIIYSDVPVQLIADPLRIRQVLTNLLSNAIKFTEHGSVVVRAMLEEERGAEVIVKVTVTDTGVGLSQEAQKDLFSAFTQADQSTKRMEGGTGLGLAISKRLVEGMGGEIGIESREGRGSTFWFTLKAERDPKHRPALDSSSLNGRRVLLAEPNEYARLGLYHMLSHWHMRITQLDNLEQLCDQLGSAEQPDYDLIIVGMPSALPASLDQDSFFGDLANQPTPLLLLTNAPECASLRLEPVDHCHVLAKPATRQRLYNVLLELLSDNHNAVPSQRPLVRSPHLGSRILLVDDHPGNLRLAQVFLEELGATVTPCNSGKAALAAFQQQHYDLVFMDIQMPGMDGKETTEQLRALEQPGRHTPVVALTAHALESERLELLKSGLDDYLSKPITETQLDHTLEKWIGSTPSLLLTADERQRPLRMASTANNGSKNKDSDHEEDDSDPQQQPVYDPALAKQRAGGREALAAEMLDMLLDNLLEDLPAIQQHFADGDQSALLERVHKLHGASRYCGTPRLEQAARALEKAIKLNADPDTLAPLVAALEEAIRALQETCARSPQSP